MKENTEEKKTFAAHLLWFNMLQRIASENCMTKLLHDQDVSASGATYLSSITTQAESNGTFGEVEEFESPEGVVMMEIWDVPFKLHEL